MEAPALLSLLLASEAIDSHMCLWTDSGLRHVMQSLAFGECGEVLAVEVRSSGNSTGPPDYQRLEL